MIYRIECTECGTSERFQSRRELHDSNWDVQSRGVLWKRGERHYRGTCENRHGSVVAQAIADTSTDRTGGQLRE